MSKLGQDELLGMLSWFYWNGKSGRDKDKALQAYQQLKEIVEIFFMLFPDGYPPKWCITEDGVKPDIARMFPQQKPKVISEVQASRIFGSDYWGEFVDRLKEIGVEVGND